MNEIILQQESNCLVDKAKSLAQNIKDDISLNEAFQHQTNLRSFKKNNIEPFFKPMKEKAYSAYKEVQKKEKLFMDPLNESIDILGRSIADYELKKREKEKREEQEELKKKRLEKVRLEEEKRAAEIELEKAQTPKEKEIAKIKVEQKEERINNNLSAPIKTENKINNINLKTFWSAEVIDIKKLLNAIMEGKAHIGSIQPNMVFLNAQARLLKTDGEIFPGVLAKKITKS